MSGAWVPIRYRDFYGVPRMVVLKYGDRVYLFDSPFDEERDEHADWFTVYRLPDSIQGELEAASWEALPDAGEAIGRVPASEMQFDRSKPFPERRRL